MYDATDSPTPYTTLHWRLRAYRGPAKLLKCVRCAENGIDKQASDWAQLHDRDGEDIMDYVPMCRKCHIDYDQSGHRTPHTDETKALLSQKNRGYEHTPEAREKIRATSTGRKHTPESRAKMSAQRKAAAAARGPMPDEQRAKLSAALKGNANAAGSSRPGAGGKRGKRTGQALENIRLGQQRRREREQAARSAGQAGGTLPGDARVT